MYSFLFRLLYCCGLRLSEALGLKYNDIDLRASVLTIQDGKFGKDRLVPMTDSLCQLCGEYLPIARAHHPENPYIFATRFSNVDSITPRCAYEYYRKILWEAGIPRGGRGKGPRLHDLRHTFSVHSLQNWIQAGVDVCVCFASRLRDLLPVQGMNQSKLADSIGVTRQAVSAYSLGVSLPDI